MNASITQDSSQQRSIWWMALLFGVATLAVGVFFVFDSGNSLETFTVILGIVLLIDAAIAIIASIVGSGEGRGALALIAVLTAIAGLILVEHPFGTLAVFILIVGIWLVIAGIARLISAFSSKAGRASNLAVSAVDLIAGIVILVWPGLGLTTFAVILGIVLILRGIMLIALGYELRSLGKASAAA